MHVLDPFSDAFDSKQALSNQSNSCESLNTILASEGSAGSSGIQISQPMFYVPQRLKKSFSDGFLVSISSELISNA